jgi:hypothetical protein
MLFVKIYKITLVIISKEHCLTKNAFELECPNKIGISEHQQLFKYKFTTYFLTNNLLHCKLREIER